MIDTRRFLGVSLLCIGLSVAACGAQPDPGSETTAQTPPARAVVSEAADEQADSVSATSTTVSPGNESGGAPDALALSPLSSQVIELESALPERVLDGLGEPIGQAPEQISIPALGVDGAEIVPVGLEDNGELEVPGADTVGWYQFGAGVGGGNGSAVLAAHIAYNGLNGVFVSLVDTKVGEQIVVSRGGVNASYVVTEVAQYGKYDLPSDDLFSESGDEQLVLITCGGSFNPSLQSYDDNVVVVAVPT